MDRNAHQTTRKDVLEPIPSSNQVQEYVSNETLNEITSTISVDQDYDTGNFKTVTLKRSHERSNVFISENRDISYGHIDFNVYKEDQLLRKPDSVVLINLPKFEVNKHRHPSHAFNKYTRGMYPGNYCGHRRCSSNIRMVPKKMGWLWTTEDSGDGLPPRRGWKPGAINKKVVSIMGIAKRNKVINNESRRSRVITSKPSVQKMLDVCNVNSHTPTLHLHKRNGTYFISMNQIKKDPEEDPCDKPDPLMFKILPHEDEVTTSSESSLEIEYTAPAVFHMSRIKPKFNEAFTQYSDSNLDQDDEDSYILTEY